MLEHKTHIYNIYIYIYYIYTYEKPAFGAWAFMSWTATWNGSRRCGMSTNKGQRWSQIEPDIAEKQWFKFDAGSKVHQITKLYPHHPGAHKHVSHTEQLFRVSKGMEARWHVPGEGTQDREEYESLWAPLGWGNKKLVSGSPYITIIQNVNSWIYIYAYTCMHVSDSLHMFIYMYTCMIYYIL